MIKKNNWSSPNLAKGFSPNLIPPDSMEVDFVILLQGDNLFGDPVYSYVQLKGKDLVELYAKMQSGENFKPSDFGTVLSAGRGVPTKEVREEMMANYNMIDVPAAKAAPATSFVQPKFFGDE